MGRKERRQLVLRWSQLKAGNVFDLLISINFTGKLCDETAYAAATQQQPIAKQFSHSLVYRRNFVDRFQGE